MLLGYLGGFVRVGREESVSGRGFSVECKVESSKDDLERFCTLGDQRESTAQGQINEMYLHIDTSAGTVTVPVLLQCAK